MTSDIGEMLHSPAAALMKHVDCDHLDDFDSVCRYLAEHAMEVRSCVDSMLGFEVPYLVKKVFVNYHV